MTTIKTTRAKGHLFPWEPKMPKKPIDISKIKIKNDPPPAQRYVGPSKYEDLLSTIKVGQNFECPPDTVGTLSQALRKRIKAKNIKAKILVQTKGEDGLGRIWLLPQ